jgi:hypothetical protein
MSDLILLVREMIATKLLELAMWIAPKPMSLHIARGLLTEITAYAKELEP